MWLPLCSDVYDEVTDFAISGFCKNIKIKISQEWKFFPSNKKNILVTHQGLIYGKNTFVAEVTFNELWPYYQKHVNQIILNCTTLWSLALQIFEAFVRILLIVNLSLNQTLLTFLLCVRQTWMTQLILAISLWEVIFLWSERILVLHMQGFTVYVKVGLRFAWDLSLENSAVSYLYFRMALLYSVSYFFFLYQ